ncbi:hypothetical protein FDW83_10515 [Pseudarthrobacter sp. NamE2]|uniref:hypothetical protein n=1 Tax=Pseudarthrobacter sp. NamE2 TaxID=2576838 RepID=UPI0010FD478B|nr:hypothetical protein [Pseudarthrobacter sp. NamE2]TLM83384.1 hypothetical protein FDW83_10515 [Pseudarthrobacter sp. NamE2]
MAKITSKWSKSLDWGEILLGHAVAMSHAVNSRAPENKPEFAAQATFALARRPDVRLECALTFTYIRNASWISGLGGFRYLPCRVRHSFDQTGPTALFKSLEIDIFKAHDAAYIETSRGFKVEHIATNEDFRYWKIHEEFAISVPWNRDT